MHWHDECVDECCRKQVEIDGNTCVVELVELSSTSFPAIWKCWVPELDGIAMVYSIDSRSSFMRVRAIYHEIIKILKEKGGDVDDFPLVIIGNKCEDTITREVSRAEGIALAQEFCCGFSETSAFL